MNNEPTVFIAKKDLIDGEYYLGSCRNASVARWNSKDELFYHWRTKFGSKFIETIKHPDDEQKYDVFFPFTVAIEYKEIPLDKNAY